MQLQVFLYLYVRAVTSVVLPTLNRQRACLVAEYFFKHGEVLNPEQIAAKEQLINFNLKPVKVGASIQDFVHSLESTVFCLNCREFSV